MLYENTAGKAKETVVREGFKEEVVSEQSPEMDEGVS